jgi:Zn-dependent peptidase ImmA (M78 family)
LASRYKDIERLANSPLNVSPAPRYRYGSRRLDQDAESIADAERRRLSIGDGPALKLRDMLEHGAGLRIFHLPLPSTLAGLYGYTEEAGPCVATNARHAHVRQRWTLSHEYGHYLTRLDHPEATKTSYVRIPEHERFADRFASAFLMPRAGLERRLRELEGEEQRLTVADMLLLADEYEVSLQALVLRLEDLHLVAAGAWDTLSHAGVNIKAASEALGMRARPADTAVFPKRFVYLVLESYAKALLTERELANLLDADRLEARKVVEALSQGDGLADNADWEINLSESTAVGS